MKVAVDGRVFGVDQLGGDASVGIYLSSSLSEIEDVRVYHYNGLGDWASTKLERTQNEKVAPYSDKLLYGLAWEQTFLRNSIKRWGPDVMFCPNSYCPILSVDCKKVISIQDLPSYYGFGNRQYRLFRKAILPIMANRADRIVTVSNYTKNDICDYLGIPRSNVGVVYNGIDPVFYQGGVEPGTQLPSDYVLFVGAKSERKNLKRVIKSFEKLKSAYDVPHKLVIVGPSENPTYDLVMESSSQDSIKESVLNPGYLSREELSFVYEHADLFVFPSLHESFGLPPVEAMASGTPVVTSQQGAIPEIVQGKCVYVNPYDTEDITDGMAKIMFDTELSDKLSNEGSDLAQKYNWENSASELVKELEKA